MQCDEENNDNEIAPEMYTMNSKFVRDILLYCHSTIFTVFREPFCGSEIKTQCFTYHFLISLQLLLISFYLKLLSSFHIQKYLETI